MYETDWSAKHSILGKLSSVLCFFRILKVNFYFLLEGYNSTNSFKEDKGVL